MTFYNLPHNKNLLFLNLSNCLCDLYGSRDFAFVGFCQRQEHFLFIMVCVSLMDRLTENKAWRKPREDVHFRLKELQPLRGMVSILVLKKKVHVVFSFPSCSWSLSWTDVCFRSSWYFQGFFNQKGIACYKIVILGIAARVFLFWG